jgi:hypothetical protein
MTLLVMQRDLLEVRTVRVACVLGAIAYVEVTQHNPAVAVRIVRTQRKSLTSDRSLDSTKSDPILTTYSSLSIDRYTFCAVFLFLLFLLLHGLKVRGRNRCQSLDISSIDICSHYSTVGTTQHHSYPAGLESSFGIHVSSFKARSLTRVTSLYY